MLRKSAQEYNTAAIRQLLLEAFTPEELRRFCHDRPDFRPVTKRFGLGYGHDDMADELIVYCETRRLFPELLAELKQHNARQYARFIEPELHAAQPTLPTPELLTISHPIDLVLVRIPAGEFQMGSVMARDKDGRRDELPPHHVHLPEFEIGQYPVTNRQYRAFVRATGHRAPHVWPDGRIARGEQNLPVADVSWEDAVAFCHWLRGESGQPFRLPTEAEWEKAARGTDGRIYPWGDEPPDEDRCNFDGAVNDRTTIGRYSPQGDSPYGCADMAGNVWEWSQSLYRPYPYSANDEREDLEPSGNRVGRGGSFFSDAASVRCACRQAFFPDFSDSDAGFRVARGPLG